MMRKNNRWIALALAVCLPVAVWGQSDTLRLSMDEALRIGMAQSVRVRSAALGVERAEHDRRTSVAQLLPNVSANGSYGYTLKKQRMYLGGDDARSPMSAMFPAEGIEVGQTHNIQAGINAQMPIVNTQLWASLKLGRVAVEQAIESARASRVDLTAEVRKAYMAVLLAQESLRVLEVSLANMQANGENIRHKYERGLVAEYDLIRMQAQLKNLAPDIIRAGQSIRLAKMKLLVLLGMEPDTPLMLTETLAQYTERVYGAMLAEPARTSFAPEGNTTLRNLDLASKQLSAALHARQAAYWPTLGANFNYTYNFSNDRFALSNSKRWSPYSMVGLSLNIPLFAGGARYYGVRSVRSQMAQIALERAQAEREVRLGVSNALSERRNASEQFVASREAVRSAEKGLEIATIRYRTGASTVLELNDAELALRQAQMSLNQSIYNYMIASFSIEQLQGYEHPTDK